MINRSLLNMAAASVFGAEQRVKRAFVATGDPAMGGDPAAGGGDPAMAGGDPAAAGGAPAGGGDPLAALQPMIQQMVQQAIMSSGGGGMGGGMGGEGGGIKPKIDVNVALMQILKIQARIADTLGIQIPASEMVATSGDLTQMAAQQQQPMAGGAAPPQGGAMGQIQPMQPMKAASAPPWENGTAFRGEHNFELPQPLARTSTSEMAVAIMLKNTQRKLASV